MGFRPFGYFCGLELDRIDRADVVPMARWHEIVVLQRCESINHSPHIPLIGNPRCAETSLKIKRPAIALKRLLASRVEEPFVEIR